MAIEVRKAISAVWKKSAKLSATWGVIVGALSIIMNAIAIYSVTIILLIITIGLSLLVPIIIGFLITKSSAQNNKIELKPAAINGAASGIVYAIVMIAISLFFIVINYLISALLWGEIEILGEGILVVIATILLGLPVLAIIGIITGAIGGAIYSSIKK
ncbi:MAG: hypothetical protein ABIH20_02560 [Candidatus Diapherotrites archaeon]